MQLLTPYLRNRPVLRLRRPAVSVASECTVRKLVMVIFLTYKKCRFFCFSVLAEGAPPPPKMMKEPPGGKDHAEDEDTSARQHCKISGCITNTPCRRIACRLRDAGRRHGDHAGMHAQSALPVC